MSGDYLRLEDRAILIRSCSPILKSMVTLASLLNDPRAERFRGRRRGRVRSGSLITPEVGVDPVAGPSVIATAKQIATVFNANFIPQNFATLPGSPAVDDIFVLSNLTQGNVLASAPHPAGPNNTDVNYSPLWQVNLVSFNPGRHGRVLNSQSAILGPAAAGEVTSRGRALSWSAL